jgi:hypothetical protein
VVEFYVLNHHYLPQVYLRQFKGEGRTLFVFDKLTRLWSQSLIKKAGAIPNLYTWLNLDGTSDDRVERIFWPTENSLPQFYEELRRGNVTQSSAVPFMMLLASSAIRVPDFIERTRVTAGSHLNLTFEKHRDELRYACMQQGVSSEAFEAAQVHPRPNTVLGLALRQIKMFTDIFMWYDWIFFRAVEGHFLTSDRPVTIDGKGLALPGTMVLFPLSRNFAAIGKFGSGMSTRFEVMAREGIYAFNSMIFDAAPRYIFSSKRIDNIGS